MEKTFRVIAPEEIPGNVFTLIGRDWMLITAGTIDAYNTMTASWGGFGVLWNKNVCFCVIRPHRYTYSFIERSDYFTLSFFEEEYREALTTCGTCSGKNTNKASAAGLSPVMADSGTVYFREACLVLECKKIYFQDINPEHFLDIEIHGNYPNKDYHRMYIGEIIKCLIK
ncbi:MAG: flavin reductase family protein [Endomicrobiales bacterium]